MTSLEGWGSFLILMLLVWSTDIIDWIADKIKKGSKSNGNIFIWYNRFDTYTGLYDSEVI